MSDFVPALSKQMTWAINPNRFNEDGKKPWRIAFFIPQECIAEFAQHLQQLATQTHKLADGTIYNYETREKETVKGFYLNGKGGGAEGSWAAGEMNLMQVEGHPATKTANAAMPAACPAPTPAVVPSFMKPAAPTPAKTSGF